MLKSVAYLEWKRLDLEIKFSVKFFEFFSLFSLFFSLFLIKSHEKVLIEIRNEKIK